MSLHVDLKHLRYFVAIVEAGSLSAAARALHIAQPALTHHLKRLEGELGRRLLVRGARGVLLTAEGERLFRHAVGVLRQMAALRSAVTGDAAATAGPVAVGLPPTVSGFLSLPLFEAVGARHPAVRLEIVDGHSRDLGRALMEGRIDLALMMPPGPGPGSIGQAVLSEELVFVCPAAAAWLPPSSEISAAELARLPMLLSSRGERLHRTLSRRLLEDHVDLDVRGHLDDLGALLAAVAAGHGATVLPRCAAGPALATGRVVARRLQEPRLTRQLLLCRAQGAPPSEAMAAVAMVLVDLVGQMVAAGRWEGASSLDVDAARFLSPASDARAGPTRGPSLRAGGAGVAA